MFMQLSKINRWMDLYDGLPFGVNPIQHGLRSLAVSSNTKQLSLSDRYWVIWCDRTFITLLAPHIFCHMTFQPASVHVWSSVLCVSSWQSRRHQVSAYRDRQRSSTSLLDWMGVTMELLKTSAASLKPRRNTEHQKVTTTEAIKPTRMAGNQTEEREKKECENSARTVK